MTASHQVSAEVLVSAQVMIVFPETVARAAESGELVPVDQYPPTVERLNHEVGFYRPLWARMIRAYQ